MSRRIAMISCSLALREIRTSSCIAVSIMVLGSFAFSNSGLSVQHLVFSPWMERKQREYRDDVGDDQIPGDGHWISSLGHEPSRDDRRRASEQGGRDGVDDRERRDAYPARKTLRKNDEADGTAHGLQRRQN